MKSTKVRLSGFWFVCYKCSLAWDLCAFESDLLENNAVTILSTWWLASDQSG